MLYVLLFFFFVVFVLFFFFQAEDGIRDLVRSRGLGDVYKRQGEVRPPHVVGRVDRVAPHRGLQPVDEMRRAAVGLSLIHI